ncbi:hypothetical protein VN12_22655 [Pirellula sp. SH-Sr6A]|uniref:hypothetical protein n=1 Tax=Pirellula sp. SH-Sr6A TaxID=1632865 RepID=UPI00078D5596|nr:hypothetical protein [Pirellula sp. SH-Sr6A]AMV34945.1 hypothetical protein VN12_22655 [Pirellula sp. SH-Sr6A]
MSKNNRSATRSIGTGLFLTGLAILAYGAIAFWIIKSLPPNGGPTGRLPSLYVIGVGIVAVLAGLAVRDLRTRHKNSVSTEGEKKSIPTSVGLLILALMLVLFFVVVSQL